MLSFYNIRFSTLSDPITSLMDLFLIVNRNNKCSCPLQSADEAATRIQSSFRGYQLRKDLVQRGQPIFMRSKTQQTQQRGGTHGKVCQSDNT